MTEPLTTDIHFGFHRRSRHWPVLDDSSVGACLEDVDAIVCSTVCAPVRDHVERSVAQTSFVWPPLWVVLNSIYTMRKRSWM